MAEPPAADAERAKFQGSWKHLSIDVNGKQATPSVVAEFVYRFEGNQYTSLNTVSGKVTSDGAFTLDPTKSPCAIDLTEKGGITLKGIYRFDGDKLTLCIHEQQRPTDFQSSAGQKRLLLVLQRQKS